MVNKYHHNMEKLTFEQLPEAIAILLEKVGRIEQLLSGGKAADDPAKQMLTTQEAAEYMGVSLSMVYKMTHSREIPVFKPNGKKVYLKRDDLVAYMSKNRISSQHEIEQFAVEYVTKNPLKYR